MLNQEQAAATAALIHEGQRYGANPYTMHLDMVYLAAIEYLPFFQGKGINYLIGLCYFHDALEDCPDKEPQIQAALTAEQYNDVVLLTRTCKRSDKAGMALYYKNLRQSREAHYVKICDRYANISFSRFANNRKKLTMYQTEHRIFCQELYMEKYKIIFDKMQELLNDFPDNELE